MARAGAYEDDDYEDELASSTTVDSKRPSTTPGLTSDSRDDPDVQVRLFAPHVAMAA